MAAAVLIGLIALLAALPIAAQASSAKVFGVDLDGLGYGSPPGHMEQEIMRAHELHASAVRAEVPWSLLEPSGPGHYSSSALSYVDSLMAKASAEGMKVVVLVQSTPCWASSAPAALMRSCSDSRLGPANAWPPRDAASEFAPFMSFLTQRYRADLAAIEVWSEPDQANQLYLAGPEKPAHYAAILRAAYPAIKQAAPEVPVLAGGLVGSNGEFLRALYQAGIKGYYDGLSVHFYTLTLGALRNIHGVQVANGDDTPLWLNEFGWSSCSPKEKMQQDQACVTSAVQASNLANMIHELARSPYVEAAMVYKLQDGPREDFGVLNASGSRKPSFAALGSAFASPLRAPSSVRLSLSVSGHRLVAAGSGPPGDYMELEAFHGSTLRYRALFTLERANRFRLRLPRALGTTGLTIHVFQYWEGPSSAAVRRG